MTTKELVEKRGRGRPRDDNNKQVAERLIDAMELLLRDHSHYDLTERKIAVAADVDDKMIHYYFENKNGLLLAVLIRYFEEISTSLLALEKINPNSETITRDIIQILTMAYYSKYWITGAALSDFVRNNSAVKDGFLAKMGPKGRGLDGLRMLFERLINLGVYDKRINATFAAMGAVSLVLTPLSMAPFYGGMLAMDQLKNDAWVSYVADLFDRQLRADAYRDVRI